MRLQEVVLDVQTMGIEVDNTDKKPFIVAWSEGKAKLSYLPVHGQTKVVTHKGKVKRIKFDEEEDF